MATSPHLQTVTVQTRHGKPTVLTRLQGLFPTTPTSPNIPQSDTSIPSHVPHPLPRRVSAPPLRFLKIRIVTWNMHETLPKGDLEELFGKVPLYSPPPPSSNPSFPHFQADANHPYHIVIVAGQECPSNSGIPMGIGAGFKLLEKEEKERELARQRSSKHNAKDSSEISLRIRKSPEDSPHESPPSGWTAMIENWLCYAGSLHYRVTSPSTSEISIPRPLSSAPRCAPNKELKKGPYQLLTKERMMGIYLAVYIHRDLKPFVRGTSKDVVTAGLIGGRLGNKGGVGISANIDGTTLLFMNCHLAAHEGKVAHRLANLAKIKNELSVDDFLAPDDPRVVSEDLTDKFDYSFLFGDLNFRLDIKRLHADWLISRQDYAQALTFDQLKNLMDSGQAFVGFREGSINFPPTFKYDVLRTLKGPKRTGSKLNRWTSQERRHRLTEVQEKDLEYPDEDDKDSEDDGGGEAVSMVSSIWTSMHSRHPTENDGDDDFFSASAVPPSTPGTKLSISAAALKAKAKWLSLVSPSSPASPTKWLRSKSSLIESKGSPVKKPTGNSSLEIVATSTDDVHQQPERSASLDGVPMDRGLLQPPPNLAAAASMKSNLAPNDDDTSALDGEKGVYDSSHKKRVPSWCDRILFKSTVQPEPGSDLYDEDDISGAPSKPRTRVMQFFANTFRPLSARTRRDSCGSTGSVISPTPPTSPLEGPDNVQPFSRFLYTTPPGSKDHLSQSRSIETFKEERLDKPPLLKSNSSEADASLRRSHSASSSSKLRISPEDRRNKRRSLANANNSANSTPSIDGASHLLPRTPFTPLPTPSRWRFFPFLSHHPAPSSMSAQVPLPTPEPPPPPTHRKGDIVCLSYDTLDDRAMRRLEGRSDHRPVVGSYAVYI